MEEWGDREMVGYQLVINLVHLENRIFRSTLLFSVAYGKAIANPVPRSRPPTDKSCSLPEFSIV